MPKNIDYDRGVMKRIHPSGISVYMYVDTPGVYLNAFGSEVAEEMAKTAGFDVGILAKKRLKNERMAAAMSAIEKELQGSEESMEVVVAEREGFTIVDIGIGRHHLKDPDGNVLTPTAQPLEAAKLLMDQLVPKPAAEAALDKIEAKRAAKKAKA